MLSSPTDPAKSRRSSHADHSSSAVPPFSSLASRRLASRQSSTATGYHEGCAVDGLGGSSDKPVYWGWTGREGHIVPSGRRFHAAVCLNNEVFVFGGEHRSEDERGSVAPKKTLLNDLVAFNAVLQEWREVCPGGQGEDVPKARKGHSLSVWRNNIVLFGGVGSHSYLNDVWIYSTAEESQAKSPSRRTVESPRYQTSGRPNRWTRLDTTIKLDSNLNARRASRQSTVEGAANVGLGGSTDSAEIPPPRAYHSAVVYEDGLYVYGGFGFSSQVQEAGLWRLDLHSHSWTPIHCTGLKPGRRYGHVACCFESTMYVFGGQVKSCLNDNDVYKFSFQTLEWKLAANRKVATGSGRTRTTTPKKRALNMAAPCPRTYHAGALLEPYERWLIHGGSNETTTFGDLYEFNIRTEKWQSLHCRSPVPLEGHGLAMVSTGVTYAMVSVGGAPPGAATLSAPALRLDILLPAPSAATSFRVEDLLLPAVALPPLMDYAKKPALLSTEVASLRALHTRQQEEAKSRKALVEKLSVENEDLRLQLEDLTRKLETSMKDSIGRSNPIPLPEETKITPRPQDGSSYASSRSHNGSRPLRDAGVTDSVPRIGKVNGLAWSPRLEAPEQPSAQCPESPQNEDFSSSRKLLREGEQQRSLVCALPNASASPSSVRGEQPGAQRDVNVQPSELDHDLKSTPPTTPPTTPPSTATGSTISHAGVDVGLQAGKGKIKLVRSRRRAERRPEEVISGPL